MATDTPNTETVLYYMKQFPHSGQNREGALIIEELQRKVSHLEAELKYSKVQSI